MSHASSPRMPISRDIRINGGAAQHVIPANEDSGAAASVAAAGLVTVMGFDRNDVLFRSDKVGSVQWRDSKGELVAILIRLKPDIWGFCHKGDDDWAEMIGRYGNPDS